MLPLDEEPCFTFRFTDDRLIPRFYPLNVLNTLKMVPEVCRIFCATANPTEVVLAETEQGRANLGVVDGFAPKGIEEVAQGFPAQDRLQAVIEGTGSHPDDETSPASDQLKPQELRK